MSFSFVMGTGGSGGSDLGMATYPAQTKSRSAYFSGDDYQTVG